MLDGGGNKQLCDPAKRNFMQKLFLMNLKIIQWNNFLIIVYYLEWHIIAQQTSVLADESFKYLQNFHMHPWFIF